MLSDPIIPSTGEVRADYIRDHTRNFDSYQVGRSLTSEQEFYGAKFDHWLAAYDAAVRADMQREVQTVEWGTALYESADEWRPEGPDRSRAVAEGEVALSRGDLVLIHRLVGPWQLFTPSTPNQQGAEHA